VPTLGTRRYNSLNFRRVGQDVGCVRCRGVLNATYMG